ncbi:phage tail tape measure protein [Bacillus thuringiensis]|uniref:phage tail tape measure protein n=3 Tax=Bacillus thuringiensis TaxID=1428 RepID=UPI000BEDD7D9|nr:phage tail tape measure protein [Bacillus thuringiensis]PEF88518.1 phage tail tape measure protein [Bacillus thuringiensis]PES54695.1 phage tail tape measure protein [Bacillus thuringiensis]PFP03613.1 phage tail tape measure protein [Bacillus thuringiensis]PGL62303.1 phage tail tape measure protein [Bacillus thuringiensis]PGP54393.1 phage tail tape measure protein [Bacillus thuringiensis]
MANAGEIKAKLVLDNAQFKRGMQEAQTEMQKTAKGSKDTSNSMSALGKASAVTGVAMVAAIGATVKSAANFEQSMAKVKAISGATDTEFQQLNATAKNLGATTQFSASQAADGLAFLSLAGFKAQDSINAMPAVLNLAAAGAIDLGSAADITSNIMTGFGLTAQDTGKAADVLTKTFTTANTDMNQLGMAMKYVAPVAKALGWDITDAATAVAKMSDAGIQGSQAGTSLRAALLSLANPTGQTQKAFEKLGISVVDANGQFKPLPELIGHISGKMEGMTDAQKTVTAAQLVGTEASAGFLALLDQGQGSLQRYKQSLEDSGGTAERVAKIQQETLIGAWTQVKSAAEGLAIGIGEALLPAFTGLAKGATMVVGAMTSIDPQFMAFTMTAIATTAAVAGVAVGVMKIVTSLQILGNAILGNPITAGIAVAAAGIGILTGVIMSSKKETQEFHQVSLDAYREMGEKSESLTKSANRFEELQGKMKLTIDEQLKYKQMGEEISRMEDGDAKNKAIKDWEALRKASGLTKEEMKEYMGINDEIIKQAPNTERAFDGKGNAIAKTADAAKKLAQEYKNMQEAELKLQEAKLFENNVKHMDAVAKSAQKAAEWKQKMPKLEQEHSDAQKEVLRLTEAYNSVADSTDSKKKEFAKNMLDAANQELSKKREALTEGMKITAQYEKDVSQLEQNRAKHAEITQAKIDQIKAANDVAQAEGDGIAAIDEKIGKNNELIAKLEKQEQSNKGINDKQREQLDNARNTNDALGKAKDEIQGLKDKNDTFNGSLDKTLEVANKTQEALDKDANKNVKTNIDEEKKKADELQEKSEKEAVKKTKGDTSDFDAKNADADKKGSKENVKKTKGDTSDHDKKNAEADKKGSKENVKKTKGDTEDFNSKNAKADKDAQKENTKKTKGDIADVEAKNADAERQMKEEVTKNLNMNASQADAELDRVRKKAREPEEKPVYVRVFESIQRTVSEVFNRAEAKKHNGGTLSQVKTRPKYHNGGNPRGLAAGHRPKFDEVDARLLKNEMVLTQAQQANLFNFIRTANRPNAQTPLNANGKPATNGDRKVVNNFTIQEMNVRDDQDIEKIAEELAKLERSKERARGI